MREIDFSETNSRNRWLGVKGFWKLMEDEVKRLTKRHLEKVLISEQR